MVFFGWKVYAIKADLIELMAKISRKVLLCLFDIKCFEITIMTHVK
ncbi:hypothetical protein XSR1_80016 [Xenorhabdus szentirmaii DSM 16338]|uniref:Uncharacterized protein n=1 Tax=Xenorhabdus szentirmaii DSM 16338 TaxID=1427518 RepID=W1J6N2_9GAMM|nr:hypothetical protein XSR1_80016 [Xenorhabdus szentirmaii DSM 16338]